MTRENRINNASLESLIPKHYTSRLENRELLPRDATFIDVKKRMRHPDKYSGIEYYSTFEFDKKRTIVALPVPRTEPPITTDELRNLARPTEAEKLLQDLDAYVERQRVSRPDDAKFIAVVEADASFDVSIHDEWGLNSDTGRDTVVGVGRTALFNVAEFSNQANVLQSRLDALASGRLPGEQ